MNVTQSCPTVCNPEEYTVHGILQARILGWVAVPFSRGSSQSRSPALQMDSVLAESQGKPIISPRSAYINGRIRLPSSINISRDIN